MNVTYTKGSTIANFSPMARPIFVCPLLPYIIWDLNNPTSILSFQFAITVTSIACPAITLLNILVILAVKKTKELKKNSNILLSNLAGAGLLVGAVDLPLAITVCALALQEGVVEYVICTIDHVGDSVVFTATCISIYFLVLIAWERYVAVTKWANYRTIITRGRIEKYARIAWLLALLWCITHFTIIPAYRPMHKAMVAMDVLASLMAAFCLALIVYYYIMVYRGVRKWNRSQIRQVQALVNAKIETKAAYTAFLLTVSVGISIAPTIVLFTFGEVWPSLRKSSHFRWSKTMLSLNSLLNPLLYCYKNRVFRKAVWKLLRSPGKSPRIQLVDTDRNQRYMKLSRYGNSTASINEVGDLETVEKRHFLWTRSQSCGALKCLEQVNERSRETTMKRASSVPSCNVVP